MGVDETAAGAGNWTVIENAAVSADGGMLADDPHVCCGSIMLETSETDVKAVEASAMKPKEEDAVRSKASGSEKSDE